MLQRVRREKLIDALYRRGSVRIKDMADELGVSLVTMRRDFDALSEKGLLKKVYGGAVLPPRPEAADMRAVHRARVVHNHREKELIGAAAAGTVREGDTVALDMGTTTLEIAKCLRLRQGITVVTNSLPVLTEMLDGKATVFALGGALRSAEMATYGPLTRTALEQFSVDVAFIGCFGITPERGYTDHSFDGVEVHREMLARAGRRVLVADSSKFGRDGSIVIGRPDCVDEIITDSGVPEEHARAFRDRGITVTVVEI